MTGADALTLPGEEALSVADLKAVHEGTAAPPTWRLTAPGVSLHAPWTPRIESLIRAGAAPTPTVEIKDLAGDGDHYAATVTLRRLQGHVARPAAPDGIQRLAGRMGGVLHALALTTATPDT
jgi:stress-induced morphogen